MGVLQYLMIGVVITRGDRFDRGQQESDRRRVAAGIRVQLGKLGWRSRIRFHLRSWSILSR